MGSLLGRYGLQEVGLHEKALSYWGLGWDFGQSLFTFSLEILEEALLCPALTLWCVALPQAQIMGPAVNQEKLLFVS